MFNNYRIPRENLLNKNADVDESGQYISAIKDRNKMHGKSLGGLSTGRVNITHIAYIYLAKAVTIAIRYAAVRRQFGPEGQDELPIIEYQLHVGFIRYENYSIFSKRNNLYVSATQIITILGRCIPYQILS